MAGVHVGPVDHIHSPLPSFGLLLTLAYQHLYVSTNRHILASLPPHYNQSKFKISPFILTLPALVSCTRRSNEYNSSHFSALLHLIYCDMYYWFVYKKCPQPSLDSIFLMLLAYMSTKYTLGILSFQATLFTRCN